MDILLLIDFQTGFDDPAWGARNNPDAEDRARDLIAAWRGTRGTIVHIRHVSTTPGSPLAGNGTAFKPGFAPAPGEALFEKTVNAAFIGTDLDAHLREAGATALTVAGLTTPHCVSTTVRMAANLGYRVRLVADACAAFATNADVSFDGGPAPTAAEVHRAALSHLHGEFAEVCDAARVAP